MKLERINSLIERLNSELQKTKESRTIVLCGGAAMLLYEYSRQETQDIDLLRPAKDKLLDFISKTIAKDFPELREDWLNSNSASFISDSLPEGWEARIIEKKKLSNLVVKVVSNEDLLHAKICAHIDREMDEEDIKLLVDGDSKLFNKVSGDVLRIKRFNNETSKIIIEELKTRLGFND